MPDLETIALQQLARNTSSDDGKPFWSVVIDDPDIPTYAVNVRRFIDAERAGYCGYVTDEVFDGLDQVTASKLADRLNELKQAEIDEYRARWTT